MMSTSNPHAQTQSVSLLLQLIRCLQQDHAEQLEGPPVDGGTKEVVIELSSGGFVYALTRYPSTDMQPQISLSQREKEIIRLVCGGLPNKAISDVLEISPWTVATYLKRIFAKLAVGSRAEMVARALQDGLLESTNRRSQ
jgi:DNA-binding CsgD family transcriptional regulator